MSATTTPIAVAVLQQIDALATGGTSDGEIARTLQEAGVTVPRDAEPHHRLAAEGGYCLPVNAGDPGRWQPETVAAVRSSTTYTEMAETGFTGTGTVALIL